MKLFKVRIEYETIIRAESATAAEEAANRTIRESDDTPEMADATEIKHLSDLPGKWDGSCIPWGERETPDRTIGQILKEQNQ